MVLLTVLFVNMFGFDLSAGGVKRASGRGKGPPAYGGVVASPPMHRTHPYNHKISREFLL